MAGLKPADKSSKPLDASARWTSRSAEALKKLQVQPSSSAIEAYVVVLLGFKYHLYAYKRMMEVHQIVNS